MLQRRAFGYGDRGAAFAHDRRHDRVRGIGDLLEHILTAGLEFLLAVAQLGLRGLLARLEVTHLGFPCRARGGVGRCRLRLGERVFFGAELRAQRVGARLDRVDLGLEFDLRLLAGGRARIDLFHVDHHDHRRRQRLCGKRGGERSGEQCGSNRRRLEHMLHQNCVPTLNWKTLVISPCCVTTALARSNLNGPNGEFHDTPAPTETRGLAESP